MLNLDRHMGNILVKSEHLDCKAHRCELKLDNSNCISLVPIDHGLSIPDSLAIDSDCLAWLSFD